jgi:YYY domain-containing protein
MILHFLWWYLIITLVGLAVTPLCLRLFQRLPEYGLAFARPLGVLLTGYLFWLGFSLGLLRNESGGAWLALIAVAGISWWLGRGHRSHLRTANWRAVLLFEAVFLLAFAVWAFVRAHDPAADHTEQPMDLMFMNSLWASPQYPPHDGWLSGYPISYYYFGYWLLVTLGRLTNVQPAIAYNLGQASWYGMLLAGSLGLVYTLVRLPRRAGEGPFSMVTASLGGVLAALWVGMAGNMQAILEWLFAQGVNVSALSNWAQVRNFPDGARVTGDWFIATGDWWWWRTSRVLADTSLRGDHQEVIAEFPAFSYILGDNHPHVMAMPIVLVVLALALAWFRRPQDDPAPGGWRALLPNDPVLLGVTSVALGSLIFLNTWDFPPYWLLMALVVFTVTHHSRWGRSAVTAALLLAGSIVLYLPYFLTAQSQARGINVNFFNPTHFPQFLWMWLPALLALAALFIIAWRDQRPRLSVLGGLAALTVLLPIAFVGTGFAVAQSAGVRERFAADNPLPDGATSHLSFLLERWQASPWTLLLVALLLALAGALWLRRAANVDAGPVTFALLLAGVGLLLVYAPEFVYLRDNFGTRMNTVFKFYYQAWLLLALAGAYAVSVSLASLRRVPWAAVFAVPALTLVLASLLFMPVAAWSKTAGFTAEPTFDASAWLLNYGSNERAAAEWLRENTPADAVIAEARGKSYQSNTSRLSTLSGRATLLGWDGHESQWRGAAYGEMAAGRAEALETIYRLGMPDEIMAALDRFGIDFVVVGPAERVEYGMSPLEEQRIAALLPSVFEQGDVRVYARP